MAVRLEEHRSGKRGAKYLRGRAPFELVFETAIGDRSAALQLEYRVKQLGRAEKIELINGQRVLPDIESQTG